LPRKRVLSQLGCNAFKVADEAKNGNKWFIFMFQNFCEKNPNCAVINDSPEKRWKQSKLSKKTASAILRKKAKLRCSGELLSSQKSYIFSQTGPTVGSALCKKQVTSYELLKFIVKINAGRRHRICRKRFKPSQSK
jgi:hypothetical protein